MRNEKVKFAILEQLNNPARAVVNSESAFVRERLLKMGEKELARDYWWWCCTGCSVPIFGEEVMALQTRLNEIDKQSTMPAWGTYGT